MSLKKSVVIDDRRNICKKCNHSNTCEYYTKYQKLLDVFESVEPTKFLIKLTCHIRKCNQFEEDKNGS